MEFLLLNSEVLVGENETPNKLYVNFDNDVIKYVTTDLNGNKKYYHSTIHPEKLSDEQRYEILSYCLSSFDKDEIVNYNDLFLHGKYVVEVNPFENYKLNEEWVMN